MYHRNGSQWWLFVFQKKDFGEQLSPPTNDDKENGAMFQDSFRSPAECGETDMLDQIPGTPQGIDLKL